MKRLLISLILGLSFGAINAMEIPAPADQEHVEIINAKLYKKEQNNSLKNLASQKIIDLFNPTSKCSIQMLLSQFEKIKAMTNDVKEYVFNNLITDYPELLEEINNARGVPLLKLAQNDFVQPLDETTLFLIRSLPGKLYLINCLTDIVETITIPSNIGRCFIFPNPQFIGLIGYDALRCAVFILDRKTKQRGIIWQGEQIPQEVWISHDKTTLFIRITPNNQQAQLIEIPINETLYKKTNSSENAQLTTKVSPFVQPVPADEFPNIQPCPEGIQLNLRENGIRKRFILPNPFITPTSELINRFICYYINKNWISIDTTFENRLIALNTKTGIYHEIPKNKFYFCPVDNCTLKSYYAQFNQLKILDFDLLPQSYRSYDINEKIYSFNDVIFNRIAPFLSMQNNQFVFTNQDNILTKYTTHRALLHKATIEDLFALLIAHKQYIKNETAPTNILAQLKNSASERIKELALNRYAKIATVSIAGRQPIITYEDAQETEENNSPNMHERCVTS